MPCERPRVAGSGLPVSEPHPAARALCDALPDVPRWVKVRALLVSPGAEIHVSPEGFVVTLARAKRAAAVGKPDLELVQRALARVDPGWFVLVSPEDVEHVEPALTGFRRERALLHVLSGPTPRLEAQDPDVFEFGPEDLRRVPESTAADLERLDLASACVLALAAGNVIASIAYVAWQTERLYDVAVTTFGPHKRRGYGERVVRALFDRRDERQRPIWWCKDDNAASLALGKKLGFREFDETCVFSPEPLREPVS